MADTTTNYKLNKPLKNENVNIDVLNQNMDIIDTNLKSLSDKTNTAVQSVKIGTTEYKSGTTVTLPNYPTTLPASDVSSWAKQNTKPTYTASEVGALPNTTTLSDFGITATATELNYVDGVTSNIQTQLNSKSANGHTHDDRYYTESETDTKISDINSSITSHTGNKSNPHSVTKSQVGLGNVENKSSDTIRGEITKSNVVTALGYTPYTPNEVDNKLAALETNIDWKESVDTFDDIATTYPSPVDGWTVNVKDTDYTYRYNGTSWVAISANAIPKATNSVDGLLSKEDHANYDDANSKKHTHSNKSVLDGISSTSVSNWNSAKTHADSTHAPSNAQANVIETVKVNGTVLTPSNKAIDISVPTKVSELTNDKNYLTSNDIDVSKEHTHTNKSVLDKITQDYLDKIDGIVEGAEVNVQSDWNAVSGDAFIKNKPDFATVATSGSYNDLTNKPTIPSVGNGTITITQNGTTKGTFTTNQSGNTTIALTDNNTTYTNQSLGNGYGTCSTAAATTAKVVTLSNYALVTNGIVAVKFTNAVPDSATMNINSKGAKAIYYRGSAITSGVINAGDIATFMYNGSQYHLLAIDRNITSSGGGGTTVYYQSTEPTVSDTTVWIN